MFQDFQVGKSKNYREVVKILKQFQYFQGYSDYILEGN